MKSVDRRGDIGLSTNAIVTIVVAIIILALLVAFEGKQFSSSANSFSQATDNALRARPATSETPLTLTSPGTVSPGEQFTIKASVYTRTDESDVTLVLECSKPVLDGQLEGSTKDLKGGATDYITIGKILETAPQGTTACTLSARPNGGRDDAIAATDFLLTVS